MLINNLVCVSYKLTMTKFFFIFTFVFSIFSWISIANGEDKFHVWISELRQDALSKGITEKTFDAALKGFSPNKRIIELDRNQPEFTITLDEYLSKRVTSAKIAKAKELILKHKDILERISKHYSVQPRFIIALWGLETNFGMYLGKFHAPSALATLAFDGRRGEFFRKELFNALKIIDEGHISANNMKSGWAGAIGQAQFMPSSFLNYAQDWDGDGKKDLWDNEKDVFASIAFYLKSADWKNDITWGRQVLLPEDKNVVKLAKNKKYLTLREWESLGVRNLDGSLLPERNLTARLITSETSKIAFLGYSNFDSILKWNRSIYFAASVGRLSDALR